MVKQFKSTYFPKAKTTVLSIESHRGRGNSFMAGIYNQISIIFIYIILEYTNQNIIILIPQTGC